MNDLQTQAAERELLVKEVQAIFAKDKAAITDADLETAKTKNARIKEIDGEITRLKEIEQIKLENQQRAMDLGGADAGGREGALSPSQGSAPAMPGGFDYKSFALPTRYRSSYPKTFMGISENRREAQVKAYRFGMWLLATLSRDPGTVTKATNWCKENGLTVVKAQAENINEAGGFLVPEELDSDLIQLREDFGVARRLFKRVTMKSDVKRRPRRIGGLTAYHLADGDGITASTKNWDSVNLTAEKIAVLVLYGNELAEDAIVDIADDLAQEIAWTFSLQEDEDAFLGNGTSAYGGFVGVCQRLQTVWGTSGGVGLIQSSGSGYSTDWSSITLANFNKMKGSLPRYAKLRNPVWVCSEQFFDQVMERLMAAAGGNRIRDLQDGATEERFLGYPVVTAQVMPYQSAEQQIPVLFGAFQLGADFGDRRETTIAISTEFSFSTDQVAIRGTERYAINVHDVGSTTNNAQDPAQAAPSAGPIVGMITPNA